VETLVTDTQRLIYEHLRCTPVGIDDNALAYELAVLIGPPCADPWEAVPSGWNCAIDLRGNVTWRGQLATPEDWAFAGKIGITEGRQ
jgi:hypothetical protein